MQYRLRTLLIVLALGPPVLAGEWFICVILAGLLRRAAENPIAATVLGLAVMPSCCFVALVVFSVVGVSFAVTKMNTSKK